MEQFSVALVGILAAAGALFLSFPPKKARTVGGVLITLVTLAAALAAFGPATARIAECRRPGGTSVHGVKLHTIGNAAQQLKITFSATSYGLSTAGDRFKLSFAGRAAGRIYDDQVIYLVHGQALQYHARGVFPWGRAYTDPRSGCWYIGAHKFLHAGAPQQGHHKLRFFAYVIPREDAHRLDNYTTWHVNHPREPNDGIAPKSLRRYGLEAPLVEYLVTT